MHDESRPTRKPQWPHGRLCVARSCRDSAPPASRDDVLARLLVAEASLERLVPGDEVALELGAARIIQAGRERLGGAVVMDEEVPALLAGGIAVDVRALLELELE